MGSGVGLGVSTAKGSENVSFAFDEASRLPTIPVSIFSECISGQSVNAQISHSGLIAVVCFLLFTGVGACAQILKLIRRTRTWSSGVLDRGQICDGLHPVREMWSFSAFLLFALSGLTRSYIDYFLLLSRLPVVLLSSAILWFLQYHGVKGAKKFFLFALCGDVLLLGMSAAAISGQRYDTTFVPLAVDAALSVIGVLLFYGKQLQALAMYRNRRTQAVSWIRESGLLIKDLTGFWYSSSVGRELLWVSVTHCLSFVSSFTICAAKYYVERVSAPKEPPSAIND